MPTPMWSRGLTEAMGFSSETKERTGRKGWRQSSRGGREFPPGIFGQVILVMSGQSRMMYQSLLPKPEGTIFCKRSKPQGTDRTPHDAVASMAKQLK